jgi:hypothetical protein
MQQFLVNKEADGEKKSLFIDEAVYTKNRNFRIYGSTKYGKSTPLISLENQNKKTNEKTFFLNSLVGNVDLKEIPFVLNYSVACMIENIISPENGMKCIYRLFWITIYLFVEELLPGEKGKKKKNYQRQIRSASNGFHSPHSNYLALDQFMADVCFLLHFFFLLLFL